MGKDKYVAYVGTYTHSKSVGIHVYDVDTDKGVLTERSVAPINNPSYVIVSKCKPILYSIADEGVVSFAIDANGDLEKINQEWIGGMRGCCLDVDSKNRYLFVGGFHDGRVTMMRLNEDGSIGDIADGIFHQGLAVGTNERRLDHPKVSCVKLTPDEKYLLAADYGLNQVKVYRIDYKRGKLRLVDIIRCTLDACPRDLEFSPDGKFLYVLTEMNNAMEVYVYTDIDDDPEFERIQQVPVIEMEFPTAMAGTMCFSDDAKFILVGVDGLNDINYMWRDPEEGILSFEGGSPISGDYPKGVAALPGNKYYVSLNHDTDEICTFEVFFDKGYALMTSAPVAVDKPNCIQIHKLK